MKHFDINLCNMYVEWHLNRPSNVYDVFLYSKDFKSAEYETKQERKNSFVTYCVYNTKVTL